MNNHADITEGQQPTGKPLVSFDPQPPMFQRIRRGTRTATFNLNWKPYWRHRLQGDAARISNYRPTRACYSLD
jgi:hypothetical protein